jgi:hypothetical protein
MHETFKMNAYGEIDKIKADSDDADQMRENAVDALILHFYNDLDMFQGWLELDMTPEIERDLLWLFDDCPATLNTPLAVEWREYKSSDWGNGSPDEFMGYWLDLQPSQNSDIKMYLCSLIYTHLHDKSATKQSIIDFCIDMHDKKAHD